MSVTKWNVLRFSLNCFFLKKVFKIYRNFQIEPVLIKGYSIAKYYPENNQRDYVDIDLVFSEEDYPKAKSISQSEELCEILIDVHKELRHHDTVPWDNLFANSQLIKLDDIEIRVLRPEDHLRVICVHWLTDGGEYRERLWDIYYLIANRPPDFDWDRCLNIVSKRRRRWIVCTIGLAHKYLGLDLSGTPIEEEAKNLPRWLIKRVEREWQKEIRLISLEAASYRYKTFIQQIWKRFPPNPITATIDCEGDFDAGTRIFYQIRDIFKRLKF
jgi:hypothetical protein